MTKNVLEKGNIFLLYRPKVEHTKVSGLNEVQHTYIMLNPDNSQKYNLIILPKKYFKGDEPVFCYVDATFNGKDKALKALAEKEYSTKTRGDRVLPSSRCIAKGRYALTYHDNHSHLSFKIMDPAKIGAVQKDFELASNESFIITVKNPDAGPSGPGQPDMKPAKYPNKLLNCFKGYRFIPLQYPDFLSYENCELLLVKRNKSDAKDAQLFSKEELESFDKKALDLEVHTKWA